MFYPPIKIPTPGTAPAIQDIEAIAKAIQLRQVIPGPGFTYTSTPNGLILDVIRRPPLIYARTRSGGIPGSTAAKMGSAVVDLRNVDAAGNWFLTGASMLAWNPWTGTVPGSSNIALTDDGGRYVATGLECPT